MADPVEKILRELDQPVEPRPEFGPRLLDQLLDSLAARTIAAPPARPRFPFLRELAAAAAVLLFIAGLAIAASLLRSSHQPSKSPTPPALIPSPSARPTPLPGATLIMNGWFFSANDAAVYEFSGRQGPVQPGDQQLEITHNGGRTWLRTGIDHVRELRWLDSQHIVIVRGDGMGPPAELEATSDGGIHWQSTMMSFPTLAAAISFRDTSEGWALACNPLAWPCYSYAIYHTVDSGAHWQPTNGVTSAHTAPFDISFTDSKHGFMSTINSDGIGRLLVTADGGRSWRLVQLPVPPGGWPRGSVQQEASCDNSTCVVLPAMFGKQGVLLVELSGGNLVTYTTSDSGLTWGKPMAAPFRAPQFLMIRSQAPLDLENWWIADGAGGIYRTKDGGRTWKHMSVALPNGYILDSVDPVVSDTLWGSAYWGNRGIEFLVKSTDGGASWSILVLPGN